MGETGDRPAATDAGSGSHEPQASARESLRGLLRQALTAQGASHRAAEAGRLVREYCRTQPETNTAAAIEQAACTMHALVRELGARTGAQTPAAAPALPAKGRKGGSKKASAAAASPAWLELAPALQALEALDAPLARIVRLRWFAAASCAEIAQWLGRDEAAVQADWRKAGAFLAAAMPGAGTAATAAGSGSRRRGPRKVKGAG